MWTQNLYCPQCNTEFKKVLLDDFKGGYETFECPNCYTIIGAWFRVEKVAVLDSDLEIITPTID